MRTIRILAYHGANLLDIAGPAQVFAAASHHAVELGQTTEAYYAISLLSPAGGAVTTSAGIQIATEKMNLEQVDTLLVAGGLGFEPAAADAPLIQWICDQSKLAARTGAICTGAFLLAQAGLLKGRRATTHWNYCGRFAADFPDIRVSADAVYVEDRGVWTSAGVLAGVDLALAMVERDMGRLIADYTAKVLVAPARRSQGEAQISPQLIAQQAEIGRIRRLMEWIAANPGENLSPSALASRAALSKRSLHRHFQAEAHLTPAAFVERARVAAARRLLAKTNQAIAQIAVAAGFSSLTTMRRAFVRAVRMTPAEFRRSLNAGRRQEFD